MSGKDELWRVRPATALIDIRDDDSCLEGEGIYQEAAVFVSRRRPASVKAIAFGFHIWTMNIAKAIKPATYPTVSSVMFCAGCRRLTTSSLTSFKSLEGSDC